MFRKEGWAAESAADPAESVAAPASVQVLGRAGYLVENERVSTYTCGGARL